MLRGNLATRPFYNTRVVGVVLGVATALLVALTAFDVWQLAALTRQSAELNGQIRADEATMATLREEARTTRQQLAGAEVTGVQLAAAEANRLIDQRAFSWTGLFNRFEATLPADVRITGIQPQTDASGRLVLAISVISRRVEDLEAFIDRLEQTGSFQGVISRSDQAGDDGTLTSLIQGYYTPGEAAAPAGPPGAPDEARPPAAAPSAATEGAR